jgi:hypothetical protein
MRYFQASLLSSSFAGLAFALPAPQEVPEPVDPSQVLNQPIPPAASGSFRGSEALLGYDASNPIKTDSIEVPSSDFELAPGQSEDEDTGIYLDLPNVENPQPFRAAKGPTDPGPRFVVIFLLLEEAR